MNKMYIKDEYDNMISQPMKLIYRIEENGWYQVYPKTTRAAAFRGWNIVYNRAKCLDNHLGWTILTEDEMFLEMI